MPTDAGDIETRIEFEELLCRRGFSRSRAKAITAKGFQVSGGADEAIIAGLKQRLEDTSPMVQEHIEWALVQQHSDRKRKRKIKRLP